tara:strand:- start:576 stop:848 length:273 start_codon:yes stop_codon:yes gene_type:complete
LFESTRVFVSCKVVNTFNGLLYNGECTVRREGAGKIERRTLESKTVEGKAEAAMLSVSLMSTRSLTETRVLGVEECSCSCDDAVPFQGDR